MVSFGEYNKVISRLGCCIIEKRDIRCDNIWLNLHTYTLSKKKTVKTELEIMWNKLAISEENQAERQSEELAFRPKLKFDTARIRESVTYI